MSDDHSEVGASEEHKGRPHGHDRLNLPREVMEEQVRPREDIRKPPGGIKLGTIALGQEKRHRFEPPNGAISKWPDTDSHFRVFWSLAV